MVSHVPTIRTPPNYSKVRASPGRWLLRAPNSSKQLPRSDRFELEHSVLWCDGGEFGV